MCQHGHPSSHEILRGSAIAETRMPFTSSLVLHPFLLVLDPLLGLGPPALPSPAAAELFHFALHIFWTRHFRKQQVAGNFYAIPVGKGHGLHARHPPSSGADLFGHPGGLLQIRGLHPHVVVDHPWAGSHDGHTAVIGRRFGSKLQQLLCTCRQVQASFPHAVGGPLEVSQRPSHVRQAPSLFVCISIHGHAHVRLLRQPFCHAQGHITCAPGAHVVTAPWWDGRAQDVVHGSQPRMCRHMVPEIHVLDRTGGEIGHVFCESLAAAPRCDECVSCAMVGGVYEHVGADGRSQAHGSFLQRLEHLPVPSFRHVDVAGDGGCPFHRRLGHAQSRAPEGARPNLCRPCSNGEPGSRTSLEPLPFLSNDKSHLKRGGAVARQRRSKQR
eukprot:scaffold155_cov347-Pavlova_lutheri.AAC.10